MSAGRPAVTLLGGWGRRPVSAGFLRFPASVAELAPGGSPRGAIARGAGRSYGDAALNAGGVVYATDRFDGFTVDAAAGTVTAGAGVTLEAILRVIVPAGWFLPVAPGTRHVTVGGALAADVHGKNHHRDGAFSDHVECFTLACGDGTLRVVRPGEDAFRATAGGMGLTGVVVAVTLRLLPIATSRMVVETVRVGDLDELMATVVAAEGRFRYVVAWVDVAAGGRSLGRGVVTGGDHAPVSALPAGVDPLAYRPGRGVPVPDLVPSGLLGWPVVRCFDALWFRRAPRRRGGEVQGIDRFFFPLDGLRRWNRLYGRRGFLQYQVAVPEGAGEVIVRIVGELARRRFPVPLAVLKRLGPGHGLLSFPIAGWTLAVDLPVGVPGLAPVLDRFDEEVAAVGGRLYLAKDARARAEVVAAMYPELGRWRAVRDRLDPVGGWRSDLARRLELI